MTASPSTKRLAWEISASRPGPSMFGAKVLPEADLQQLLTPELTQSFDPNDLLFLSSSDSIRYLDSVFDGRDQLKSSNVIFFRDALATSSIAQKVRLNRGRELLRNQGKTLVFAESTSGSPEIFDELRDLLATFRNVIDLRPSVIEDDHLWDSAGSMGLARVAESLPRIATRGSTIIKAGLVHRKATLNYRCPACGGKLTQVETVVRFAHAPIENAEQVVPGYRCDCGESWPDPRAMKEAHRLAFGHDEPSRGSN